jgi:hypothetical protein
MSHHPNPTGLPTGNESEGIVAVKDTNTTARLNWNHKFESIAIPSNVLLGSAKKKNSHNKKTNEK